MMERMRTKCSWDPDQAGTQFVIANLTNKGLVDIDMSKTEGNYLDKIAAEDTDSDLDDVFGADRTVQEVSLKQELEDAIKLNDLIRKEITNVQEVNAMSEGAEEEVQLKLESKYDSEPVSRNLATLENVARLPEFKLRGTGCQEEADSV